MSAGFRRVLGPYNVYEKTGPLPLEVVTIDFKEVRGGIICVQVQDNLGANLLTNDLLACAIVEVSLLGLVKGVACTLVTQAMRSITGPLIYSFEDSEPFENISIRARMMRGGQRLPAPDREPEDPIDPFFFVGPYSAFLGYSANLSISIQPRMDRKEGPSNV